MGRRWQVKAVSLLDDQKFSRLLGHTRSDTYLGAWEASVELDDFYDQLQDGEALAIEQEPAPLTVWDAVLGDFL